MPSAAKTASRLAFRRTPYRLCQWAWGQGPAVSFPRRRGGLETERGRMAVLPGGRTAQVIAVVQHQTFQPPVAAEDGAGDNGLGFRADLAVEDDGAFLSVLGAVGQVFAVRTENDLPNRVVARSAVPIHDESRVFV